MGGEYLGVNSTIISNDKVCLGFHELHYWCEQTGCNYWLSGVDVAPLIWGTKKKIGYESNSEHDAVLLKMGMQHFVLGPIKVKVRKILIDILEVRSKLTAVVAKGVKLNTWRDGVILRRAVFHLSKPISANPLPRCLWAFHVYFCISHFFSGKSGCQDETLRIRNDFISGPSLWLIGVLCHAVWQSRSLPDSVVTGDEHHVDESGDDHTHCCTLVRHTHMSKQRCHTHPAASGDLTEIKERITDSDLAWNQSGTIYLWRLIAISQFCQHRWLATAISATIFTTALALNMLAQAQPC